MSLDTAYIFAEITAGDSLLTPRDIINQLIANDDDDTLADMLEYFYQRNSTHACQTIDKAITDLVNNSRAY